MVLKKGVDMGSFDRYDLEDMLKKHRYSAKIDQGAVDALRGIHINCAMQILIDLEEKDSEIRNPSGFIFSASRHSLKAEDGAGTAVTPEEVQARVASWGDRIDDRCRQALYDLSPADAVYVLNGMGMKGNTLRDPIGFCLRLCQ